MAANTPFNTSSDDYIREKLFNEYVGKITRKIIYTENLIITEGGITPVRQRFAFIVTQFTDDCDIKWYTVRLIVDEEHRNFELIKSYNCFSDEIVELKKFTDMNDAMDHVLMKKKEYKNGVFTEQYQYRIRRLPRYNARSYLIYGDLLRRRCFLKAVYHDGVYIGNGVASFNTETDIKKLQFKAKAYVKIDTFDDFLKGTTGRIHIPCFRRRLPEEICQTARHFVEERYGEGQYTLHGNNCQTFATTCVYGYPFIPDIFVHKNFFSRCFSYIIEPTWKKKVQERKQELKKVKSVRDEHLLDFSLTTTKHQKNLPVVEETRTHRALTL